VSLPVEPRHHEVRTNGVDLHVVTAGDPDAPPVLLLHGFPEFWYAWRGQIEPLVAAGYRVVAPDLRGYNRSAKPHPVSAYRLPELAADVAGLIDWATERADGDGDLPVVGHDWGGTVAFATALAHPGRVGRLVVMNTIYPARLDRIMPARQVVRSWYAFAFQLPWLPEALFRARDFAVPTRGLRQGAVTPAAFTDADLARYRGAWSRPGVPRATTNYYRAFGRDQLRRLLRRQPGPYADRRVAAPTLLLWGERDDALVPELAPRIADRVPDCRVQRYPDASHWLHHEFPDRVADDITAFVDG
jgi:pimeloyl-ACP methyl ester carboxylesterase